MEEKLESLIVSEPNLDSGGGFYSRAVAAYTPDEFVSTGYDSMIDENRKTSNEMWTSSFSVASPVAIYRSCVSLIEGQTPSWREILYRLTCPKTFIFGERSLPDPDFHALEAHHIPIETVPEAGHSMAWENPKGLAKAIRAGLAP